MNKIWGYPLAAIRLVLLLLLMFIWVVGYVVLIPILGDTRARRFKLRSSFLVVSLPLLNIKRDVQGEAHDKPALYVCNHRSFTDPMMSSEKVDCFVIAKAEIGKMPLLNWAAELTGVIYVKRESRDSRADTRKKLVDTIKEGYNVMVYPEGTTNNQKELMRYLNGTFREVAKIGAPVVPIILEYRDKKDMWRDRSLVAQYFLQFSAWRTETKMVIGPAIYNEDGEKMHSEAVAWSKKTLSEVQSGWSRAFPE